MEIVYVLTVVVSLAVYVGQHWDSGSDLYLGDFLCMVFCALVPVANILLVIHLLPIKWPNVLVLRGRK